MIKASVDFRKNLLPRIRKDVEKNQEKARLRVEQKEALSRLSLDQVRLNSHSIQQFVIQSDEFQQAAGIFVYLNTSKEPETGIIVEEAQKLGKRVFVPKCLEHGQMAAVSIDSLEECTIGAYGLLEPVCDEEKWRNDEDLWKKSSPVLSIIPCLSAGTDGSRLGHGAGFYDRFLQKKSCITMVLCFEDLLREDIPMTSLDRFIDLVVTEKRIYDCRKSE